MKALLLVIVLVGSLVGQEPCNIPLQFMTIMQQIYRDNSGCAYSTVNGQLYYDWPNSQIRIDQTSSVYTFSYTETLWLDYDNEIAYIYYRDTDMCNSADLTNSMPYVSIPNGSYYEGDFIIGNQAIDNWITPHSDGSEDVLTVTRDTCFIVTYTKSNFTSGTAEIDSTYYDFLPDLTPFYFDIPALCTNASKKVSTEEFMKKMLRVKLPFQY